MTVTTVYSRLHQLELELAYHRQRMQRAATLAKLTGELHHEQAHEFAATDAQNVADEIEHLKLVLSAHEPEETMPTVSEIYPSEWLKAVDLNGRTVTVTIEAVEVRRFDSRSGSGKEETKLVVSFVGAQKRLVCNVTQARAIAAIANSEDTKAWPGVRIQLKPDRTKQNQDTIAITAAPVKEPAV